MLSPQTILIDTFAQAIAWRSEFFYRGKQPTLSQQFHNPGLLEHWLDPQGVAYPNEENGYGYVEFPACQIPNCRHIDHPCEIGWRALRAQIKINVIKRRLTFREFFAGRRALYVGFAPAHKGFDPNEYANFVMGRVSRALGLPATLDTVITSLAPQEQKAAAA